MRDFFKLKLPQNKYMDGRFEKSAVRRETLSLRVVREKNSKIKL